MNRFYSVFISIIFLFILFITKPLISKDKNDFTKPLHQKIEQILFLSNQWIIVVIDPIDDVIQKIDELSGNTYLKYINLWNESEKIGKPNWYARDQVLALFKRYFAQARVDTGEFDLDSTNTFIIKSGDDRRYQNIQHPLKVTRFIPSIGGTNFFGAPEIHFVHYCYLKLPFPMQTGATYTITLKDNRNISFTFDEKTTISRAIKINQLGYLPDSTQKYAYLGAFLHEFGPLEFHQKTFQIIDATTKEVVFEGEIKKRLDNIKVPNPKIAPDKRPFLTGEIIYEMDFTPLKKEGTFFISIKGVGRSWSFKHSKDVYGKGFYISSRGLFHQRCGTPIKKKYSHWTRKTCHTDPVFFSDDIPLAQKAKGYHRFDVIAETIDYSNSIEDATGGWHDAADWDKNIMHYTNIFDLLYAFEIHPEKFYDSQLHIPESGNGVPDILDEAAYGLKVWTKSMNEQGGVSGTLETWTHPKIDDPSYPYAYSKRTRASSLAYAAAAAQLAYLIKPFNHEKAASYEKLAKKAYRFGNNPKNSLGKIKIRARENRGQGKLYFFQWEESDEMINPYLIHAKLRLYILTKEKKYLKDLSKLLKEAKHPYQWPNDFKGYSAWIYYPLASPLYKDLFPELTQMKWQKIYVKAADQLISYAHRQPYKQSIPIERDYWLAWGASVTTNYSRALLIAYSITNDDKYRQAAILNTDFMLGNNALGISWTTGIGSVYPIDIQHSVSTDDHILDPVPGITVYGITGGYFYALRKDIWDGILPDGEKISFLKEENRNIPLWRKWSCHPYLNTAQCEFTIYETMSSMIFTMAMLMPENWMPNEKLKNLKPKPKENLHGIWYLP